jgi:hypothetical protein
MLGYPVTEKKRVLLIKKKLVYCNIFESNFFTVIIIVILFWRTANIVRSTYYINYLIGNLYMNTK